MITFGIIGVGGREKSSFHAMKHLDWLKLQAVCDVDEPRMNTWADELDVTGRYTSHEDLLAADMDFVYIATSPNFHAKMVIQTLEAGKHVLSELPAVESLEEARNVVDAVERTGRMYMLGENYCYRRDIQAFRNFVQEGQLGKIVYARGVYTHDVRRSLGTWTDQGIRSWFITYEWPRYITHALAPLLFVTGDRVSAVSACVPQNGLTLEAGKPSFTTLQCRTETGAIFQLLYGLGINRSEVCYSFTGEDGTIESLPLPVNYMESNPPLLGDKPYRLTRMQNDEDALSDGVMIDLDPGRRFHDYRGGGHWESDLCFLATFAECIRDGKPSPIDVYRAMDASLPGICALESIRKNGVFVDVPKLQKNG